MDTGNTRTDARSEWERVERVVVCDSSWRARYPSVTRSADGSVLVLFSRQTPAQDHTYGAAAGLGDLVLASSNDDGKTWSEARVIHEGEKGESRAVSTMTTLSSGRIIVPLVEMSHSDAYPACAFRLLSSPDNGSSWQVVDPEAECCLSWWAPRGKVIETADGTLVMPVYGAITDEDLKCTIHNCGLLRSSDGGKSWGDFSWIARGAGSMIGAAPESRFSFEGPSVQVLPDGRWLAVLTARRLNKAANGPTEIDEGPGTPQALCRVWSADEGRQWTKPDLFVPGACSSLALAGEHVLCANTLWAAWGGIQLEISDNALSSVFQELIIMDGEWMGSVHMNRPQETPLPPTVPYLAWPWTKLPRISSAAWPFDPYGYPSLFPLDRDRLIAVFCRPQRRSVHCPEDLPGYEDAPIGAEQIQAVFFERAEAKDEFAAPLNVQRPRGRWVLAERVIVEDFGACAQMANGDLVGKIGDRMKQSSDGGRSWTEIQGATLPEGLGAFGILRSGRWLGSTVIHTGVGLDPKDWGTTTLMGTQGGYPVYKHSGVREAMSTRVSYSDDRGMTWHAGEPFTGPLKWAIPCACHFLESADGTVALPIFGCVTEEEVDSYSASNGVIRSHDGGETWGDFSFLFRTNPKGPGDLQPEPRYSEMDFVELPNGHWVAYSRTERIGGGPNRGSTAVAVSTDCGRTWTRTGGSLQGVSQQTGVILPDGGIALTYRTHSWQAAGVAITYDEGRSFDYLLTGPYETVNAFLTREDEFVVFTSKSHRSDMAAAVYRWIPG